MSTRKKVLVTPSAEFDRRTGFFELLAGLYPVDFVPGPPHAAEAADAVIAWLDSTQDRRALERTGKDVLAIVGEGKLRVTVTHGRADFGRTDRIDRCFREQTLHECGIRDFPPLGVKEHDVILCSLDSHPYWICRPQEKSQFSIIALGPPIVTAQHTVYQLFNRLTWLRLLPFLHFVKRLTQADDWTPPPLRACLIFDDPNLHWDSYGFMDFPTLARHAAAFNYHAAVAMIPADTWYFNPAAARSFRQHPRELSLLIHGNNHVALELGAMVDAEASARLLAQALRRIERFERRSGLSVARVMVPPHGAFWTGAANAMLSLGYEAVSVSRASLTSWNKEMPWPAAFGHGIVEFVGDGFPVIPRQAMARNHEGSYRLAAFLNQPIVPHGHHRDCAEGLSLLAHVAREINSIGNVTWSDMTTLSRSNYQTRRSGDTLFVRMLARDVTLPAPDADVRQIVAERPWISGGEAPPEILVCEQDKQIRFAGHARRQTDGIAVTGGAINLYSRPRHPLDPHLLEAPALRLWPILRRLLSETRDRVAPLLSRTGRAA